MGNKLMLGITKIGDILLNNMVTMTESGQPLKDIILGIPEYQRPYKWTAKNAKQLLDDIEEAMKTNKEVYRVGTLILHDRTSSEQKNGKIFCDVVDGQQRIITFSLLLKCMDSVKMPGTSQIDFLNQKLSNNQYNLHNIVNNYRTLRRRVRSKVDDKERVDLFDYICNHCELIVVITTDLSEAFQFFDSQNARGKALYPHDLLKAYHLREMNSIEVTETERIVKSWEDLDQKELSVLFKEYLYRLKEWVKGNRADELTERNIDLFKGVTSRDRHPYAQYYKGAFVYADELNHSNVPLVTGIQELSPFQINTPIIAGKPFFEYTKHYFNILADIQNNSKYEGVFINDNEIVKTLDLGKYKNGVGNRITRLMFDTAILLYVDRFCPARPSQTDTDFLEQFVVLAFIWSYSMRAQYWNVGWQVAQNYILGISKKEGIVNGFNIYKVISEADSPNVLLSKLADLIMPIPDVKIKDKYKDNYNEREDNSGIYMNYLHFFAEHEFWEGR